jgi:hypothetical protein
MAVELDIGEDIVGNFEEMPQCTRVFELAEHADDDKHSFWQTSDIDRALLVAQNE